MKYKKSNNKGKSVLLDEKVYEMLINQKRISEESGSGFSIRRYVNNLIRTDLTNKVFVEIKKTEKEGGYGG